MLRRSGSSANASAPFEGRTVHLVSDLTLHEQLYLYEKTRLLKKREANVEYRSETKLLEGCTDTVGDFAQGSSDCSVYLIFCEESTRTKDSFRNAAVYHKMHCNEISDAKALFKKETVADVVKMLASYSTKRSLFVIRSPMEGVCRWLENAMDNHYAPTGSPAAEAAVRPAAIAPRPCFLNAGDGRHTHPTLEYVDVFTLLELNNFDRSRIHIALVGDLLNGRTAHSKVDGLKIFDSVTVDLVAPAELQYPVEYKAKMEANGFTIREYASIEEYFAANEGSAPEAEKPSSPTVEVERKGVAKIWNFSRLQIGRIGEEAKGKEDELYDAVVFRPQWRNRLPEGCKFLQTLPRDPSHPLVPYSFDFDDVNAYELASSNGYWVRITLLAMLTGRIGADFVPQSPKPADLIPPAEHSAFSPDFAQEVKLDHRSAKPEKPEGQTIRFESGLAIDHIMRGATTKQCWAIIASIRKVMGWMQLQGSQGVYNNGRDNLTKGVISLPGFETSQLTVESMKKLAALAPGCTVNFIKGGKVVSKHRLATPARIFNIPNVQCKNVACVSHEEHNQPDVCPDFVRVPFYITSALKCQLPAFEVRYKGQLASLNLDAIDDQDDASQPVDGVPKGAKSPSPRALQQNSGQYLFVCRYCMWPHFYKDIWRQ